MAFIALKPVSCELLVEGRLSVSGFIPVRRPETGTVGSEHFVAQDDIALLVQSEFEFGIRDDNAARQGVFCAFLIEGDRIIPKFGSIGFSFARESLFQIINTLPIGDILVMVADLGLGGRRIDRFRQFVGFP